MEGIRKFSFENLEVYKVGRELVKCVYSLIENFPVEERFALADQIRRSTISITSNIAEGAGRNSMKEKVHFIEIAFGSLLESFSQMLNAQDLGYISEQDVEIIRPKYNYIAALLSLLKKDYESKV